jgi:hypothetical protein
MSVAFDEAWTLSKNESKGKFRGYSKNTVSGRAERAGKAKAWNQSRKVKRGRTRKRYSRNKSRGNVRPKMRRQLGAGGSRAEVSKDAADINAMVDAATINELVEKASTEPLTALTLGRPRSSSPIGRLAQSMGAINLLAGNKPRLDAMEFFGGAGAQALTTGGYSVDPLRRGHNVLATDIGAKLGDKPMTGGVWDWEENIMRYSPKEWMDRASEKLGGRMPDVLFASPTCVDMSLAGIGSKWKKPQEFRGTGKHAAGTTKKTAYNKAKLEAFRARKDGEAPSWMGEATKDNPTGTWEASGSNKGTAKLMAHTFAIGEEFKRRNPAGYVMIENPVGMSQFMPFTYSKDLPDMAMINMASYTNPAAGMFGIPQNVDPNNPVVTDPLESSVYYDMQTPEQRAQRARTGDIRGKPLKRTVLYGDFPDGFIPRPRLGQIAADPTSSKTDQAMRDGGIRFTDFSQDPSLRQDMIVPRDFITSVANEGMRRFSSRGLKRNALVSQPLDMLMGRRQVTGNPEDEYQMGGSLLSGSGYAFAPKGSNRGVQQTRGYSFFDPISGRMVKIPAYHAKSIVPSQLGADFMRAVERAENVEAPVIPDTEFHMIDPNERVREYLERPMTTIEDLRAFAGDRIADLALENEPAYKFNFKG